MEGTVGGKLNIFVDQIRTKFKRFSRLYQSNREINKILLTNNNAVEHPISKYIILAGLDRSDNTS